MNQTNDWFESVYKRYHSMVFHHLMAQISYQPQFIPIIEECVQDAFVQLALRYDGIRDKSKISKWLCMVARNALLTELRKQKRLPEAISRLRRVQGAVQDAYENGQERLLTLEEHQYKIRELEKTLTPLEQDIYHRYFVQENSLAETSARTGKSINTIRSALERVRKRYKKL